MALRLLRTPSTLRVLSQVRMMSGYGDGVGKGGGTGGSIRDAGGSFGKMEAAREEEYFRKLQRQQIEALKKAAHESIKFHEEQIGDYEEAIRRHKSKIRDLRKMEKKPDEEH